MLSLNYFNKNSSSLKYPKDGEFTYFLSINANFYNERENQTHQGTIPEITYKSITVFELVLW